MDADAAAVGPVEATYHDEGLAGASGGSRGVYVVRLNIDKPGNWLVMVVGKPDGAAGELYGGAAYPAVDRVSGTGARRQRRSRSRRRRPTTTGGRADTAPASTPRRTRRRARCMRISLDVALANGKPTVFNIGTPKFCTSQVCGPVVDVIQTVADGVRGPRELRPRRGLQGRQGRHRSSASSSRRRRRRGASPRSRSPTGSSRTARSSNAWSGPIDVAEVRDLTQRAGRLGLSTTQASPRRRPTGGRPRASTTPTPSSSATTGTGAAAAIALEPPLRRALRVNREPDALDRAEAFVHVRRHAGRRAAGRASGGTAPSPRRSTRRATRRPPAA